MTLQEIFTVEHKGITVAVKVDYHHRTVSLVETARNYNVKSWVFGERGLDYLKGWQDIIEAMGVAVKKGKELLEVRMEHEAKLKEDQIINMLQAESHREKRKN